MHHDIAIVRYTVSFKCIYKISLVIVKYHITVVKLIMLNVECFIVTMGDAAACSAKHVAIA